ncbi:hemolysin III [Poseidonocella pacifica]|uniref:Hemolysin III n=1 Tax=Poseidonocella pacifica TaxID=871651 RepID=A0A1I0WJE1_9RHOB|nr:hemolysin III family protein [Poseidonocella pacifica]SFA88250.1 hemolysin III [Poseidonocella pacifica]
MSVMKPYPIYTRAERVADVAVHLLGLAGAIIGIILVFSHLGERMGWGALSATLVYFVGLILMISASMAYHLGAYTAARPILRRLDHAAIYLKIAGTFTPLSVLLGTAFGYAVLACVWAAAIVGVVLKFLTAAHRFGHSWLPYVALGWAGVLLFIPLVPILPWSSLLLLSSGGLLYTGGVVFYVAESLKFSNAIWHSFVICASACFFLGIALALAALL